MGHIPVLYDECLNGLNINPNGVYLDMTVGGFGHGRGICEKLSADGMYIGFDKDIEAIKRGELEKNNFNCKIEFIHKDFKDFAKCLDSMGVGNIDGCLIDLGVSSFQLDESERGFSFMNDGPLDMRMDQTQVISAKDIVNNYQQKELFNIIKKYGEDKFAANIAKKIVEYRVNVKLFETTGELSEVVKTAIPKKFWIKGKNPATRTFQALRIEVNSELDDLSDCINALIDRLAKGGRLAIISFHSLEDRIVKEAYKSHMKHCECPKDFPICICGISPIVKSISGNFQKALDAETQNNTRSRSAKLRIIEKL